VQKVRVQTEPLDLAAALAAVSDPACGGLAFFVGTVRNTFEGRASQGLFYEAYPELAEKEMRRIADELEREFGVRHVVLWHRIGELGLGEAAVLVAASAPHRDKAIAAVQVGIDRVKARAPIWKKERWADGGSGWHHDSLNLGETPL
jgi:molybdopterin synthase catalytic subunit